MKAIMNQLPLETKEETDYNLLTEEAVDELLESSGFPQTDHWLPVNEHWRRCDEGFFDAIKSGWNKITGGQQQKQQQPKKRTAKKASDTKKKSTSKTAQQKPAAKKSVSTKTSSKKPQAKSTTGGGAKKGGKGSKMAKKAIEMGKKHIQKKIGGPKGVEAYVKKNQKKIDKKMQNAPSVAQNAWTSIKTIVAAGGKKTIEFCKKHWKAIVIVLCVIIAICILVSLFNGSGTEAVANSEIAKNSITEINKGAGEISSGTKFIPDDDVNIDDDGSSTSSDKPVTSPSGKTYDKDYWGDEEKANGGDYYQHTDDGKGNTTTKWRVRTGNRELYNKAMNLRDQVNDHQAELRK